MSKKLEQSLGLTPTENGYGVPSNLDNPLKKSIDEEISEIKDHVLSARDMAMQAVQDLYDLADKSQNVGAYDALGRMLKTYTEISERPLDIELKKNRITGQKNQDKEPEVINNNLFVGSTSELFQLLDKRKNEQS